MDKLTLLNANNVPVEVNVIRFFSLNNNYYLLYSMNEVDEQNYLKLYAVKVTAENNAISSSNINDENEWNAVKEMVKKIIKENKEGTLDIEDLDYNKLENLKVNESKVFKLSVPLVELLQANKKLFAPTPEPAQEPQATESQAAPDPAVQPAPAPEPIVQKETQPNKQPIETNPQPAQQATNETMPEVDYQSMYLAEKANNDRLSKELEELKNKIDTIKNML